MSTLESILETGRQFGIPENSLKVNVETSLLDTEVESMRILAERSHAVLELLMLYFQAPPNAKPFLLKDITLSFCLSQLSGNMELITKIGKEVRLHLEDMRQQQNLSGEAVNDTDG